MWQEVECYELTMKDTLTPALLLLFSFLFTYLFLVAVKARRRSRSLPLGPPGPQGWPIIGNLLHIIGKAPHRSLANLSRFYGPVMSLKVGSLTTVVISSPEAAREVLTMLDPVFSARTFSDTVLAMGHQDISIPWLPFMSSHCSLWRKMLARQISSRKRYMATKYIRMKKVKELITFLIESNERGESVEIYRACFVTSLNVISKMVFSIDLGCYDPNVYLELQDSVLRVMEIMGKTNLADYFPSLESRDLQGIKKDMKACSERMFKVFQNLIDARIEERSLRSEPIDASRTDLLDSLIDLVQENGSEVNLDDIKHFLCDLFIMGSETNATTVEWALAELFRNPEAMANAKVEINFVVGPCHYICDSDLIAFPYLDAVVQETLRLHPPTPFLLPRKAQIDLEVLGYMVPKNTQILVNAWAIGRDPSVWENAERFMPERFLGRDIDTIDKDFEMIPFGAGRRMCPGSSLALRIVPHMLASLVYAFTWSLETEKKVVFHKDLDMDETFGFTLHKTYPLYSDFVKETFDYLC